MDESRHFHFGFHILPEKMPEKAAKGRKNRKFITKITFDFCANWS